MRARAAMALPALALCILGAAACSPGAPKGVDKAELDDAVSRAIGGPATCVLIAEQASGKVVYRYNSHTACARSLPACDRPGERTLEDLLRQTVRDGQPRKLSCHTLADASRGVGWASGTLPAKGLVYAAMMEGARAFPGRMMADRLDRAFHDVGLSGASGQRTSS
jgi:hypothetical protein